MNNNSLADQWNSIQNRIVSISKINSKIEGRNRFINSLMNTCVDCDYLEGLKQLFELLEDKDVKLHFQFEALAKAGSNNQLSTFKFITTLINQDYHTSQLNEVFNNMFKNDNHEAIKLGIELLCRNKEDEKTILGLAAFFDNIEILEYVRLKGWDLHANCDRTIKHAMIFSQFETLNYFNSIGYDLQKVYESPIVEVGSETEDIPPHNPSEEVHKWMKLLILNNKLSKNLPEKKLANRKKI